MKFYPLADQIIIRLPKQEEEKKINGIILAATIQKEQDTHGTVIEVGSGRILENGERIKPEVSPGDKVIFAKYAGTEIADGEDRILILRERDILCRYETVDKTDIRIVH